MSADKEDAARAAFESAMAANGYHLNPQRYRDGTYRDGGYAAGWAMWQAGADAERERICAAIKVEDDYMADRDYMLDSDDCIRVARGQWVRPE